VKKNALAGKRFGSWSHLNAWLLEWATTVADRRVHGTTHERPIARFAAEQLTPLGSRPRYAPGAGAAPHRPDGCARRDRREPLLGLRFEAAGAPSLIGD